MSKPSLIDFRSPISYIRSIWLKKAFLDLNLRDAIYEYTFRVKWETFQQQQKRKKEKKKKSF